ncbi:MAG: Arm DNA-binding domain-containing protein [Chitinophagaceae bacterium]
MFWLNKTRCKNLKPCIYLRLTINRKRIELSTYQYVDSSSWNKSLQRLKPKVAEAQSINRMLDLIQSDIHRYYSLLIASNETVTAEMVKNAYLEVKEKQYTIWDAFGIRFKNMLRTIHSRNLSIHPTMEGSKEGPFTPFITISNFSVIYPGARITPLQKMNLVQ